MITILDYDIGNVASIANMLRQIGVETIVSSDADIVANADALILPGVGAFDHAMSRLHERSLIPAIKTATVERKRPMLGICLGMQLLFENSEEGELPGLGLLPGKVKRFDREVMTEQKLKVPHMGWNVVNPVGDTTLFASDFDEWRFYFVHSYHAVCDDPSHVLATTPFGSDFTCVVGHENVMGAQFHPEKSHKFGKALFSNFVELTC